MNSGKFVNYESGEIEQVIDLDDKPCTVIAHYENTAGAILCYYVIYDEPLYDHHNVKHPVKCCVTDLRTPEGDFF